MAVAHLVSGVFRELFSEHVGLAPLAARATAQESQEPVAQGLQVVLVALLLPRHVLMLKQRAVPVTSCARGTGYDPWSRGSLDSSARCKLMMWVVCSD